MTTNNQTPPDEATGDSRPSRRTLLAGGAATVLAAQAIPAITSAASASARSSRRRHEFRVGAGKAEITIPVGTYQAEGYANIHDPLHARLLLAKTDRGSLALLVLDLTSVSAEAIAGMRSAISEVTGVPSEAVMVTVTHNFSSPHVGPAGNSADSATWVANLQAAAKTAARAAVAGLRRARVGYGTGSSNVNVNRNLLTKDGYYLGANEHLPSDKTVLVARFDDASGDPIAILTNYSVQSSVIMESNTSGDSALPYQVSSDLAGAAAAWVEDAYPGVVAPFLCGATGDQQPIFRSLNTLIDKDLVTSTEDEGSAGWTLLKVQGERLGTEIVRVAQTIRTEPTSEVSVSATSTTMQTVATTQGQQNQPTTKHRWVINGTQPLPVWTFRIGDGVFAGTPPELSTSTLLSIRHASPFKHTFVAGMFEGGNKNMPDRWSYDHITYAALDGNFAPGSAEKYVTYAGKLIRTLGR